MNRVPEDDVDEVNRRLLGADRGAHLAGGLLIGYALLVLIGLTVFRSEIAMVGGNQMSWARAIFAATNAGTLTGFQQTTPPNDYETPGQVMALLLTLGGAFFTLVIGSMAVVRILRLPYDDRKIMGAAFFYQALAMLLGTALLSQPGSLLAGPFQGSAAFANSGMILGALPDVTHWQTHLVLLPLAVLGGLGLPVIMESVDLIFRRRPLSVHARTVLAMTAGIYLLAVTALTLLRWTDPGIESIGAAWPRDLAANSVAATVTRTAGLPFEFAPLFPAASMQWLAMLLMLIGASPGGTGGGLKTTTLVELAGGVRAALRGKTVSRSAGIAGTWLAIYLLIAGVCLLALLQTEPQLPADRAAFLAVSAASCVGLSHNPIALSDTGLYILSIIMLAGRLTPLAILWWMAITTPSAARAVG